MSNGVMFEDYSIEVKSALKDRAIAFLNEVGELIVGRTKDNSKRVSGQTADSFEFVVDEGQLGVFMGSNFDNALWEEFGTGIHAIHGDGRKTPWSWKDSKGRWHRTQGKKARRPFFHAFESSKGSIQSHAEKIFGGL